MRIAGVRPRLSQFSTVTESDLLLSSAIEDPALRPNYEVESDYDGLLHASMVSPVALMHSVGHYKRLDADGLFQTILTKLSPRSECAQVLHYSVRLGH
jgi:hypothetical protein